MSKVADFIVEIGTEELPPKDLQLLSQSFAASLHEQIETANIPCGTVKTFATPRRLAVLITQLGAEQPAQTVTKRGPSVKAAQNPDGTPSKAAIGFAQSFDVSVSELSNDGDYIYFTHNVPPQKTIELIPAMIEKALTQLPVKKYMRWGNGEFSFVRPVHWLLMLYGDHVVHAEIFGIKSDHYTRGHRVLAPKPIKITNAGTYVEQLHKQGNVIADFAVRQDMIRKEIERIAHKQNAHAVIDPELLNLVTGLVESPVALLASFDQAFLRVPKECLISAMQDHQKCFALKDQNGQLLPKFILISNIESTDPQTVIYGNELVMHARLADAAFHFDNDQKKTLASRVEKLKEIVYQKKLGSLYDKVARIEKLATFVANQIGADVAQVSRAAHLCKADLVTNMVYEFPELQGIMGFYYAAHDGETDTVADAIKEHYLPRFAADDLPVNKAGLALAIADRVDSLIGLFGTGNIPTGEKDPFGLRRQSLAVLRMLIEKNINLDLQQLFQQALNNYQGVIQDPITELLNFCIERLKAWYIDRDVGTNVFAAVAANKITNPFDFDRRIHAVNTFLSMPAAQSLAAANKRVANILSKDATGINKELSIDVARLDTKEEKDLYATIQSKELEVTPLLANSNYSAILQLLSTLQEPVDNFFNNVMVMVDDPVLRNNRINLLQRLRNLFLKVADVSLL